MKKYRFTAGDVHRAYPWIPGTTLFNRIKSGIIPVEAASGGPGEPYQFSLGGMVHIGVTDELHSLGVWKSGVSGTDLDIEFSPSPLSKEDFYGAVKGIKDNNKRALIFYGIHGYGCKLLISIKHRQFPGSHSVRQKRSTRTFQIVFAADPGTKVAPLTHGSDKHGPFIVLTNAEINVFEVFQHLKSALDI